MEKKYRHAVAALVLRPKDVCSPEGCTKIYELLLVHKPRIRDAWQLPQGGIEENETLEQTAVRELKEEVGLTFESVTQVCDATYSYDFPPDFLVRYKPTNAGQKLCFVIVVAEPAVKIVVDNREVDAFVWILPDQLPRYIKRKEYLDVILQVLSESKSKLGL